MKNGVARIFLCFFASLLLAVPALARQTGSIAGKVTATDGSVLPGVTVEVRSPVLPGPRVVVTESNGEYRLPTLPPGSYTITFTLSGMQKVTRDAQVQLGRETPVDVKLGPAGVTESVTVTAESSIVDRTSATLNNGLSSEQMKGLPIGQDYRDLIKLIPAVQYTPDGVRGPSAGGSGQDNVYQFDGVNVTLPLFGTLSAEPAAHDIGADLDRPRRRRSHPVRSVRRLHDRLDQQVGHEPLQRPVGLADPERRHGGQDRRHVGLEVRLRSLVDGAGRRRADPAGQDLLLRLVLPPGRSPGATARTCTARCRTSTARATRASSRARSRRSGRCWPTSPTGTRTGSTRARRSARTSRRRPDRATRRGCNIGSADASWVINPISFATVKWTHFVNRTQGRPDNVADVAISTAPGTHLDIDAAEPDRPAQRADSMSRTTTPTTPS